MKKNILTIFMITTLLFILVSCKNTKFTYTTEFTYLPKHASMSLKEFKPGENGNFGYAYYSIPIDNYDKFLTEYESILKKDGWTIKDDQKPAGITIEKGVHSASMALTKFENEATLVIASK